MQTKDLIGPSAADARPLFGRLPHGPHRLDRRAVLLHQRTRIHGAMIEAIARDRYQAVSVKQVIALAGVSRRSFYEQFANKEDCFLATFDRVAAQGVRRVRRAYLRAGGDLADRLGAAFAELALAAEQDPAAAALAVVAPEGAGMPAVERLRGAIATCELMLASGYRGSPGCGALGAPIVRAVAGGLHAQLAAGLRGRCGGADLAGELTRWTLQVCGAANERTGARLAANAAARGRRARVPGPRRVGGPQRTDERSRLLRSALRLSLVDDYLEVSAPQIAEQAGLPIEGFRARFEDRDDCYRAALDMLAADVLAGAADPGLLTGDWPRAVRRALAAVLELLARNQLYAGTLAVGAFAAGPAAVERGRELTRALARTLTAGAPAAAGTPTVEAIAGAIWHTIGCLGASGRIRLLPLLSDHLAYVVLAPYLGADAAGEIANETRP
jgi:AcrR family transcriptional regulator